LQTRGYKLKDAVFVFANDIIVGDKSASFYLSLGICGRYLGIYEQLVIIKSIPIEALKEAIHCFYMDRFDVIIDYIASDKTGKGYLILFTRKYEHFLEKSVYWNTKSDALLAHWEKCKQVLDTK